MGITGFGNESHSLGGAHMWIIKNYNPVGSKAHYQKLLQRKCINR